MRKMPRIFGAGVSEGLTETWRYGAASQTGWRGGRPPRIGQKTMGKPRQRRLQKEITMSSILTNNGAMVALQTMKNINASLGRTQSEISTGKTVANAKDNATVWMTLAFEE